MLGPAAGQMLNLLAARDPGRDDLGLRGGGLHRGRQPTVSERDRDVVVFALEAERAGHPAAARVDLLDLEARPAERCDSGRRADERLLVAVPVEQRFLAVRAERKLEAAAPLADQELLEQERLPGHRPRVVPSSTATAARAISGTLYVVNVSLKSTTSPRGAADGGVRRANQSVNVCAASAGSGRRRSMPATFSSTQRLGASVEIQFTSPGSRAPR